MLPKAGVAANMQIDIGRLPLVHGPDFRPLDENDFTVPHLEPCSAARTRRKVSSSCVASRREGLRHPTQWCGKGTSRRLTRVWSKSSQDKPSFGGPGTRFAIVALREAMDVRAWLEAHDLGQYAEVFASNDIDARSCVR